MLRWLIVLNVVSFALYGLDKWKAVNGMWRIRERTLLIAAVAFGAFGAFLAMQLFRHKTRTPVFCYGVPVMMAVQAVILFFVLRA